MVTARACGVSSVDDHSVSTSPDGRTRSTAPFSAPPRRPSAGRGVGGGPVGAAWGAITAKLSLTVTSAVGVVTAAGSGSGPGGRDSSRSLPSTTAA